VKITLHSANPAAEAEILRVEQSFGHRFPPAFREFLALHNGARPARNLFAIPGTSIEAGVSQFTPLDRLRSETDGVDGVAGRFVAAASDDCGNYVCVRLSDVEEVFFWDHELPHEQRRLAATWSEFLEMLEPFDPRSVTLKPGQVKRAWINPNFLRKLKGEWRGR